MAPSGCLLLVQECLGENDRDWTKCQAEVQALKQCHQKQQKLKAAQAGR